jgi:addiction module HigA family antidote
MIKKFKHKGLKNFYATGSQKGVNPEHVKRLRTILARLDASKAPEDMDLPGLRLHPLKGERHSFWTVDVSGNWRVFFRFENGNAVDVDYHEEKKMVMHNPPHPGEVIKELCIEPLGLTVTEAAKGLGVSRKTLSALLNGRFGISPEMAIRLSKAFGGSPESWLIQQSQYDLWQVMQKQDKIKVKAFA